MSSDAQRYLKINIIYNLYICLFSLVLEHFPCSEYKFCEYLPHPQIIPYVHYLYILNKYIKILYTIDILLANFKDGYVMAEKGGLQQDMSIHVRFVYDESVLRFVLRMDGQPWRASALTPAKGSNTQSHFICTAAR